MGGPTNWPMHHGRCFPSTLMASPQEPMSSWCRGPGLSAAGGTPVCYQFRGAAVPITSPGTLLPRTDPEQDYFWEAPWQSSPPPSNAGGAPCLQALLPLPAHPSLRAFAHTVSSAENVLPNTPSAPPSCSPSPPLTQTFTPFESTLSSAINLAIIPKRSP